MTIEGVAGLRACVDDVLTMLEGLPEPAWREPTGCTGWTVHDVVAHMGAIFHGIVDPAEMTAAEPGETTEQANERPVAIRRDWTSAAVLAEYRTNAPGALAALEMMNGPDLAQVPFTLGDLGTYPMGMVADALCFDHWCHLHVDMATPAGPIDVSALPAADDLQLSPTISWMLAGLPQMCPQVVPVLTRPVRLVFEGPGGRTVDLLPADDSGLVGVEAASVGREVAAVVTSPTTAFVAWATQRRGWRGQVTVEGDVDCAASVLDAINVI